MLLLGWVGGAKGGEEPVELKREKRVRGRGGGRSRKCQRYVQAIPHSEGLISQVLPRAELRLVHRQTRVDPFSETHEHTEVGSTESLSALLPGDDLRLVSAIR